MRPTSNTKARALFEEVYCRIHIILSKAALSDFITFWQLRHRATSMALSMTFMIA
jgi:hypothetical protein